MADSTLPSLDAIQARADAATEGPWEVGDVYGLVAPTQIDGFVYPLRRAAAIERTATDAAFIADARTAIPALSAAIRDVLAVHSPIDALLNPGRHEQLVEVCTGCGTDDGNFQRYPCPTVRAISAHIDTTPKENDR